MGNQKWSPEEDKTLLDFINNNSDKEYKDIAVAYQLSKNNLHERTEGGIYTRICYLIRLRKNSNIPIEEISLIKISAETKLKLLLGIGGINKGNFSSEELLEEFNSMIRIIEKDINR